MGIISGTTAAVIGALAIGAGVGIAGASMMGGSKKESAPQLPEAPKAPVPEDATKKALDEERLRRSRQSQTVLTKSKGLTEDATLQGGTLLGS